MKINRDIASTFNEIADTLEILDKNSFKIRAYRKEPGVQFIEPDLRYNLTTVKMAESGSLPDLIDTDHIRGIFTPTVTGATIKPR